MQLVAYGAQDIYLTGNPQITFFKVVYRRHTNFAVESIEQTFNGSADLNKKFSCTIARNGDLLSRVYLEMDLTTGAGGVAGAGGVFSLVDYVELEIGGQCIDKHYGDWMELWTDLSHDTDKRQLLSRMVRGGTVLNGVSTKRKCYLPLQFWFCRNPGLALPLIALQYHEVKLNVQFKGAGPTTVTAMDNVCVYCDYIFLDTDERRRFAQVSHEYLIEQLQYSNALNAGTPAVANTSVVSTQAELRFSHPVKELIWDLTDSQGTPANPTVDDALLQLNGHDRFRRRSGSYFTNVQRYQHHTGATGSENAHVYSFALKPEDHQPSGTCNFSRIDNAVLNLNYKGHNSAHTLRVYAVNYNVLRIMSGMGGLAYSN